MTPEFAVTRVSVGEQGNVRPVERDLGRADARVGAGQSAEIALVERVCDTISDLEFKIETVGWEAARAHLGTSRQRSRAPCR